MRRHLAHLFDHIDIHIVYIDAVMSYV